MKAAYIVAFILILIGCILYEVYGLESAGIFAIVSGANLIWYPWDKIAKLERERDELRKWQDEAALGLTNLFAAKAPDGKGCPLPTDHKRGEG